MMPHTLLLWRTGGVHGRSAARPAAQRQATEPQVQPDLQQLLPRPASRPSALKVEVLSLTSWWQRLVEELDSATEVTLGSFVLDHSGLVAALLQGLQRRGLALTVLVDKEAFEERTARHQRPRLQTLRQAGAQIYICRGSPPLGRFHVKAVCLDRRVVYTGSANFTDKSTSNTELVMRLLGPPVLDVRQLLEEARACGKLWDGS